jgi:hypothetical protein
MNLKENEKVIEKNMENMIAQKREKQLFLF